MPTKKKKSVARSSHRAWDYPLRNRRQKNRDNNPECGDEQGLVKLEDFEEHPTKDPGYVRIVISDPAITPELTAEIAAKLGGLKCIIADSITSRP
ncbi:S-M checkpoint control protein rad4 [Colletotrichum sp. SAR 10_86]|nr:S-M checkpoint control protein rad4 [Colletotrichum sp. SAR 10_65]KAI8213418.1 S-M checkpoint control protein rad4 [Colletotrichum sp. SAR 10_76]KAI8236821.1 S-M checkpoint control protein rad4 [Colletotrichum sp. SAR 10_86]